MKLNADLQRRSKEGFWPGEREALVGGSYVLVREGVVVEGNLCEGVERKVSFVLSLSLFQCSLCYLFWFGMGGRIRRPTRALQPPGITSLCSSEPEMRYTYGWFFLRSPFVFGGFG